MPLRWRSFCSSVQAEAGSHLLHREELLVGGEAGPEQRDVVVDGLRQVSGIPQLLDRRCPVTF
jgi:hypothetical protein